MLFNSYKFRNQAARKLLERAKLFSRKTFVSATPIERDYWLNELKELPEYRIEWPHAERITVHTIKCNNPVLAMARDCKARMKHGGEDNYHIFLNSVEGISKIIRLADLPADQCRVVCSQNQNKDNQSILPPGFHIMTTNDQEKLFNFYTSTCFEGQDIYDERGRTFIVSEPYKDHTMMDIMTSLIQICGRIRDSKYKTEITQYYATSPYKEVTLEEYKESVKRQVEEAKINADSLNRTTGGVRKSVIEKIVRWQPYIQEVDDQIVVDENMANYEIVNYKIVNGQYKTQTLMNNTLAKAGVNVDSHTTYMEEGEEHLMIERTPFKKIFEEYVLLRENV